MIDREALRDAIKEVLEEHGLALEKVVWTDDLKKGTTGLALKVGTPVGEQTELDYGDGDE